MIIKRTYLFLVIILLGCSSTANLNSKKSDHSFTINFMGQYFEEKEITLSIDDNIVLDKTLFGKIPYPQTRGIHEISVGYRDEQIDILKRYKVFKSFPLAISNLKNIKVTVHVDSITKSFTLDTRKGKDYYLKYDTVNDIQLNQLTW